MSRYYYLTIFIFILTGCTTKQGLSLVNSTKIMDSNLTQNFPKEDELTLYALDSFGKKEFKKSFKYYEKLYKITKKDIYATRAIKSAIIIKDYTSVKKLLESISINEHKNPELNRYMVAYYIDKKMLDKAKELTDKMLKKERSSQNLELSALVLNNLNKPHKSLKLYEESYRINKGEYALLKITDILYLQLKQKQKATRLLEAHTTLYKCSQLICTRLAQFYIQDKNTKDATKILEKLYLKTKNPSYAQSILEIYSQNRLYKEAILFLKKTKLNDILLLDFLTANKDFDSAQKLAFEIYERENDLEFLAKSAILEYEGAKDKNSSIILKSISKKMDKVVLKLKNPIYYNYYGYLLIDHNLDIDRGILLVKKALEKEPNSHYFLDSLAWGLYKKGECKEAYEILEPISKITEEKEIISHMRDIKNCLEKKK